MRRHGTWLLPPPAIKSALFRELNMISLSGILSPHHNNARRTKMQ
jgi:hypothetical protein